MESGLSLPGSHHSLAGLAPGEGVSVLNAEIPGRGRPQVGATRVDEGILQDPACGGDV